MTLRSGAAEPCCNLLSRYSQAEVVWVVFSSGREREREARESAALFLKACEAAKGHRQEFSRWFLSV